MSTRAVALAAILLVTPSISVGQDKPASVALEIQAADTVRTVLARHQGKTVTVLLAGGGELTGNVKTVTNHVVHLSNLTGKDYYDAVVDIEKVTAVVVRAR